MQIRSQKSIFAVLILSEVTRDKGVYVLNQKNMAAFLANNEYVLVDFYPGRVTPGLQPLAEEYAKAAQILANKGSPIKLAKVNIEEIVAEQYDIKVYEKTSIVKIFKRDPETSQIYIFTYNGFFKADDIISWVERFILGELDEYNNRGIKKITHEISLYLGFPRFGSCHRVSVQGVKSLGGHFACLCRGLFYEVKKKSSKRAK